MSCSAFCFSFSPSLPFGFEYYKKSMIIVVVNACQFRDAALAYIIEINQANKKHPDSMSVLQTLFNKYGTIRTNNTPLQVIELGSGCGIVGIMTAHAVPRCSVLLTDLEEVHDIVKQNVEMANLAKGSDVTFEVLDWDQELPEGIITRRHDLILVSDCTYNPDSFNSLIATITALAKASPGAAVLVALKRRHETEGAFFHLMHDADFFIKEHSTIALPDLSVEDSTVSIEIYAFYHHGHASS